MKKLKTFLYFLVSLLFIEILFKIIIFRNVFDVSLINLFLFLVFVAILCTFICSLFSEKVNKRLFSIILFILGIYVVFQKCLFGLFGLFFSFSLFGAAGQTMEFGEDILRIAITNIGYIILFLLPFIGTFFACKYLDFSKLEKNKLSNLLCVVISSLGVFFVSLLIGKNGDYSAYKLYFEYQDMALSVQKLGVINSFDLDVVKTITGFREEIKFDNVNCSNSGDTEIVYEKNNLDIDFDELINNESNSTIKTMHEYFKNESGTYKNEYTNYFKDKNLILFMAESFNEIAVSEELTPTLYKLVNSGFVFDNFYTPTISSTIGGEYQELTGLYAASGFVSPWKEGKNSFPLGIAKLFKEKDYSTYGYHDHTYTFQSRNKYLSALGFDNFKGCGNGLEKSINCKTWPESDVDMIDATIDDYVNSENPFMVFYASVSGHGDYYYRSHAQASKYKDVVKDLPYSEKVRVYIAAQIELDKALEELINKLDEAGKLDDTVIALVGDHYPYFLSVSEVNEASSYEKDSIVEINRSNFILWNNKMDKKVIDKVGSQIDVLPTIYNLFGINYDSRLIIGKDILSTEPGLAMFGNRSWVSDYGTYYSATGEFKLRDGKEVDDNYVRNMNKLVSNRITMSKLIITEDYYRKALGE